MVVPTEYWQRVIMIKHIRYNDWIYVHQSKKVIRIIKNVENNLEETITCWMIHHVVYHKDKRLSVKVAYIYSWGCLCYLRSNMWVNSVWLVQRLCQAESIDGSSNTKTYTESPIRQRELRSM